MRILELTVTYVSSGKFDSHINMGRHHLLNRGWVDFGSDVPSILRGSSALSARQFNPTQVREVTDRPVLITQSCIGFFSRSDGQSSLLGVLVLVIVTTCDQFPLNVTR